MKKEVVDTNAFNQSAILPYELRLKDFEIAMQDIYDFFFDVNLLLRDGRQNQRSSNQTPLDGENASHAASAFVETAIAISPRLSNFSGAPGRVPAS